ncbi:hypothetical protein REPUB_Repub06bG0118400 [Reevesia pubescens]
MDQGAIESFQAQAHLYKHTFNFVSSMSLKCAVQLGIPDIIHKYGEPITLSELVSATLILPKLVAYTSSCACWFTQASLLKKIVDKDQEKEAYVLTPFLQILLKDKMNCTSPFFVAMLSPAMMTPWQFFGDRIQGTKQTRPFEAANGKAFWDYMDQDPEFKNLFHEAMESDSQMMNLVVKDFKPVFEGLSSLVDVGGGTGTVTRVI